jgi:hypothetical protein
MFTGERQPGLEKRHIGLDRTGIDASFGLMHRLTGHIERLAVPIAAARRVAARHQSKTTVLIK